MFLKTIVKLCFCTVSLYAIDENHDVIPSLVLSAARDLRVSQIGIRDVVIENQDKIINNVLNWTITGTKFLQKKNWVFRGHTLVVIKHTVLHCILARFGNVNLPCSVS